MHCVDNRCLCRSGTEGRDRDSPEEKALRPRPEAEMGQAKSREGEKYSARKVSSKLEKGPRNGSLSDHQKAPKVVSTLTVAQSD